MSNARVLELDSQQELLERLSLLTRFGSNLVVVGGHAGCGKSWLSQRFLEQYADEQNQSLLLCHPNQTEQQHRTTIVEQWFPGQDLYTNQSLTENLERILDGEPCQLLLVVDDAHLLSDQLLSELWLLNVAANQRYAWSVNIVLMVSEGSVNPLLRRLSFGQELKPVEMDIEPLDEHEAERFFEFLVMRYVEPDMEKQVRRSFATVTRYPGEIMALAEQKKERRVIVRSIVGSPMWLALIVLIVLLLIGGGYWWLNQQATPDENRQRIESMLEQTVIPTLPRTNTAPTSEPTEDPLYAQATDDSSALPPEITSQTATVGVDDSDRRVVITADVVDALLDESATAESIPQMQQLEQLVIQDIAPPPTVEMRELTETAPPTPPTQINFSFAREELLAFSPRSYTVQIAALTSLEDVQAFLDEHQVDGEVRVYPTERSQVTWYIVTYENYPSIQAAREAIATLPGDIKELGPWAKAMTQVHREIEAAN
ncbi:AAA family ATPase [Vibrio sp. WXL103]|uniref:AAA family ATPase n=1 Tax=Vibrio sp. WXL103 TaxID=3450710 RepID=UPI003EC6FA16